MFQKILIANRGEIACRIIETARSMGIQTVAVYSDADRHARHVRMADEAIHIGPAPSRDSYLRGDVILSVARKTGAQAIHPGYGFLSENAEFAQACADSGIVFIGPSAHSINAMGLKDKSKDIMQAAGVPIVPGYMGEEQDPDFLKKQADGIGYPVLIKAVAGGGGKGMRRVDRAEDFSGALESCQREAKSSFGNAHVLIEKYISKPRHIEVQVFGDNHGNAVYLFERDCSLQRRHQKVIEEAPAPGMSEEMRRAMGQAAVKAAKTIRYSGAGTIEFIVDVSEGLRADRFYFMEMNTRLQVEHPVTEMITGIDLVEWQLRIASGEEIPLAQSDLSIEGHSFEARLYAEDPANQFLPQVGCVSVFDAPDEADSVRVDSGIDAGDFVSIHYDPMIAKMIVHAPTRDEAIQEMAWALNETVLAGLNTNQEFLGNIFRHPEFIAGDVDTGFIPRHEDALVPEQYGRPDSYELALLASCVMAPDEYSNDIWSSGDNWRLNGVLTRTVDLVVRGGIVHVPVTCHPGRFDVRVGEDVISITRETLDNAVIVSDDNSLTLFHQGRVIPAQIYVPGADGDGAEGEGRMTAPMPGKIVSVLVRQGDVVSRDQPLIIMEAMKMEMTIKAGCDGIIGDLPVVVGQQVADGALLVAIEQKDCSE